MRLWYQLRRKTAVGLLVCATAASGGCGHVFPWRAKVAHPLPPPPAPVGTLTTPIWRIQEANAEASDFVIYQHEFEVDGVRLNYAGEDHVKQIAARLQDGLRFPVVIERTTYARRLRPDDSRFLDPEQPNHLPPGYPVLERTSSYEYPVHLNPQLDMQRREVVVQALLAMNVADAEERVLVSPAFAEGFEASESERAYLQGINGSGFNGNGGNGFGFFGGFGGFGGFGRFGF